jgi:hypothetical protein
MYVHTGSGTNFKPNTQHVYWKSGNYIWNNTGDTATLRSSSGRVYDACSWGTGSGVTYCGFKARKGLPANPGLPGVPVETRPPTARPPGHPTPSFPTTSPTPSASASSPPTALLPDISDEADAGGR